MGFGEQRFETLGDQSDLEEVVITETTARLLRAGSWENKQHSICTLHYGAHLCALCREEHTYVHCALWSTPLCTVQGGAHLCALCTVEHTSVYCAGRSTPLCRCGVAEEGYL